MSSGAAPPAKVPQTVTTYRGPGPPDRPRALCYDARRFRSAWSAPDPRARVAKLADAPDLGSGGATRGGSNPPSRTRLWLARPRASPRRLGASSPVNAYRGHPRTHPDDDAHRTRIRAVAAHAHRRGAGRRGGEPATRRGEAVPAGRLDARVPQGQGAARPRPPGLRRRDRTRFPRALHPRGRAGGHPRRRTARRGAAERAEPALQAGAAAVVRGH